MSMSTCKCGKVFDSDFQMSHDEKGNCCCDDCDQIAYEQFIHDLKICGVIGTETGYENITEKLMNMGYRKIK